MTEFEPLDPHGAVFVLYPFRLRGSAAGGLVFVPVVAVAMTGALTLILAGGLLFAGGLYLELALMVAGLFGVGWLGLRFVRRLQPLRIEIRPNGIVVDGVSIPRSAMTAVRTTSTGTLRIVVEARSGEWTSPPLDETHDRLTEVVAAIQALIPEPDERRLEAEARVPDGLERLRDPS